MSNSITIRKSNNPNKKTSYAIFFYEDDKLFGTYTTPNGSILDLGHLVNNYLNHNSVPSGIETKTLKVSLIEGATETLPKETLVSREKAMAEYNQAAINLVKAYTP